MAASPQLRVTNWKTSNEEQQCQQGLDVSEQNEENRQKQVVSK